MTEYGLEPQVALTLPILVGTDGVERMSKSRGNYVGLTESPAEQFGKVMSIPDEAAADYWRLCLSLEPPDGEAMESKLALARGIVERYHGPEAATEAEAHFTRVVRERSAPDEIPTVTVDAGTVLHLPAFLKDQFGESSSHWRRVVTQGGVRADGEPTESLDFTVEAGSATVLQAGKRRYVRVEAG